MQDKNFDALANKFSDNIYGTLKGQIRLALLHRDLNAHIALNASKPLRILDAGGGYGHFSQALAQQGHEVVLCDISQALLDKARMQLDDNPPPRPMRLIHSAIQDLKHDELGQFDLILCHAVVEWLSDAKSALEHLLGFLKPQGHLSLMFYNADAQRFHALVSGNFDYINKGMKVKKPVRLTPNYPLTIDTVESWQKAWQLEALCKSGVRVFHDYFKAGARQQVNDEQIIDMELRYSQHTHYWPLGRYIHFLLKK